MRAAGLAELAALQAAALDRPVEQPDRGGKVEGLTVVPVLVREGLDRLALAGVVPILLVLEEEVAAEARVQRLHTASAGTEPQI